MSRDRNGQEGEDYLITPRVRSALTDGITGPSGVEGRTIDRAMGHVIRMGMRYARFHGADSDEADDVGQKLAIAIWERREQDPDFLRKVDTEKEKQKAIAFVVGMARNTFKGDRRAARREAARAVVHAEERAHNVAHSMSPTRPLEDDEVRLAQMEALARLDPLEKRIVLMRADGLTYQEIAVHTGRTESAAKSAAYRARAALRADCEARGIPVPELRRG